MSKTILSAARVRVWRNRYGFPYAICQCGWTGRGRLFRAAALVDAHLHSADTGHWPTHPIDAWKAALR